MKKNNEWPGNWSAPAHVWAKAINENRRKEINRLIEELKIYGEVTFKENEFTYMDESPRGDIKEQIFRVLKNKPLLESIAKGRDEMRRGSLLTHEDVFGK